MVSRNDIKYRRNNSISLDPIGSNSQMVYDCSIMSDTFSKDPSEHLTLEHGKKSI